jgi:hypothetical protein
MTIYRVLVNVPAANAIGRDAVVNNWGINGSPTYTDFWPNLLTALKTFYDGWQSHRSHLYTWTAARAKLYNLEDPAPRAPLADTALSLSSTTGTNTLPQEVSICLSFQGARVSGTPQARRRGRLYLGPLASVSNDNTTGRPSTLLQTNVKNAASAFRATSLSDLTWAWVVIHAAGLPGMAATDITDGWVDDAFDTQRRRGNSASLRGAWT